MPLGEPDADDPMELRGAALPGDSLEAMAESFVEEYMLLGTPDEEILRLFRNPAFGATHWVWREKGEDWVRGLVARTRAALEEGGDGEGL